MKVSTEKLPKSLLALDIELDKAQVEKGLDKAARKISQRVQIPGFRKGKAPRFIVENYYGRDALIDEASEDLINQSFRQALESEQIEPVGRANLENVNLSTEPYSLRVTVPVQPEVALPAYAEVRVAFTPDEISDDDLERALEQRRERHVVLKAPEEPRPAQQGDQLTVRMETYVDGEPLEDLEQIKDSTLVLEPKRLIDGLYDGILGVEIDETREVTVSMPEDHGNEQVAGKDVIFKVTAKEIQERMLPDWDELPTLEEAEGTLDELRAATRNEMIEAARKNAENSTVDGYIAQLVEQVEWDLPEALVEQEADAILHEQGQEFARYSITLEQMLQYRGQTHDEAVAQLLPQGELRLKNSLVLREIIKAEGITVGEEEIAAEAERMLDEYAEDQRENVRAMLNSQLRATVATGVLNQKLRDRLFQLATGAAPAPVIAAEAVEIATDTAPALADDAEAVEVKAQS
ncbi:MAG: trigger factor [Roseiflexaceae bacterium]|nr:trigger factor [Roseiflexaceae bacterium]